MDLISVFFIIMSILVISYFIYLFNSTNRLPIIVEIFYVGAYGLVFLIFLFPNLIKFVNNVLGINNIINFIVYLSIFMVYLIILFLYKKSEDQRVEITKLTREIAYLKNENRKNENK